jgi:hypothetical protein
MHLKLKIMKFWNLLRKLRIEKKIVSYCDKRSLYLQLFSELFFFFEFPQENLEKGKNVSKAV